ncbi:MAG: hypothetical protein ACTS1Z_00330 [Parasphingopyxis sp.]|uniref:hypothetical protein n=1 Tax=Parasphingopyxis sp. TaxID=1920299 RepID=UPI003F9EE884
MRDGDEPDSGAEEFMAVSGEAEDAEKGMAEMSEKFREEGGNLYLEAEKKGAH